MADLVPGFGPQGFEPSGGPQTPSAEEKLAQMMQMMQGAPNSVLQMISRIFRNGEGPQMPQAPQQWDRMPQMPMGGGRQNIPNVNGDFPMPMRPSEPPQMPLMNPGFIRG